jgi:hypothetical protein
MLLITSCSDLAFVAIRSAKQRKCDAIARDPFVPFLGLGTMVCSLVAVSQGS